MSAIQHAEARKLLKLIESAVANDDGRLNYRRAAEALGRDPKSNSRMVAQVCDLLDAAAALAGVPLLALVWVRELSDKVNRKAWTGRYRDLIIHRSEHHQFTAADFGAIAAALGVLAGKGNRAAWEFVYATIPKDVLFRRLAGLHFDNFDAINDLGADAPDRVITTGFAYARDPKIRDAVKRRAEGKCEFCGALGFMDSDGAPYLECHHIIALANDGEDRMTNVIALCPNDHREAHFGKRRAEIEKQMREKIVLLMDNAATTTA